MGKGPGGIELLNLFILAEKRKFLKQQGEGKSFCKQLWCTLAKLKTIFLQEHMPLWHGGGSFGYMFKSDIAGSSGSTMSNFLRNSHD